MEQFFFHRRFWMIPYLLFKYSCTYYIRTPIFNSFSPYFFFFAEALLGKEHKDQQVNYDVKIGDGMDIAIHGENGNIISI